MRRDHQEQQVHHAGQQRGRSRQFSRRIRLPRSTEHTVTVTSGGNGTASASPAKAAAGAEITPERHARQGLSPQGVAVMRGNVTIKDDKFTMDNNVWRSKHRGGYALRAYRAYRHRDQRCNGTVSRLSRKGCCRCEITLSATPDRGYHLKEWQRSNLRQDL